MSAKKPPSAGSNPGGDITIEAGATVHQAKSGGVDHHYHGPFASPWKWLCEQWSYHADTIYIISMPVLSLALGVYIGARVIDHTDQEAISRAQAEQKAEDDKVLAAMQASRDQAQKACISWKNAYEEIDGELKQVRSSLAELQNSKKSLYADFAIQRKAERTQIETRLRRIQDAIRKQSESWAMVRDNPACIDSLRTFASGTVKSIDQIDATLIDEWEREQKTRLTTDAEIARKHAESLTVAR